MATPTAAEKKAAEKRDKTLAALAEFHITDVSGTDAQVPLTGSETQDELDAILAAAKKAAKDSAAPKKDATSAAVLTQQGAHIRTYTKEDHGDDFADLAKEFSDHTPGSSVSLS